jgi:hypothetical protein
MPMLAIAIVRLKRPERAARRTYSGQIKSEK